MVSRSSNPPACRQPAGVTASGRPARDVAISSTKCSYECPCRVAKLMFCGNYECASSIDKGVHLECEHSFADRWDSFLHLLCILINRAFFTLPHSRDTLQLWLHLFRLLMHAIIFRAFHVLLSGIAFSLQRFHGAKTAPKTLPVLPSPHLMMMKSMSPEF